VFRDILKRCLLFFSSVILSPMVQTVSFSVHKTKIEGKTFFTVARERCSVTLLLYLNLVHSVRLKFVCISCKRIIFLSYRQMLLSFCLALYKYSKSPLLSEESVLIHFDQVPDSFGFVMVVELELSGASKMTH